MRMHVLCNLAQHTVSSFDRGVTEELYDFCRWELVELRGFEMGAHGDELGAVKSHEETM
jgi:hypothetical protein